MVDAIPTKKCCSDPCALFDKVPFPAEAFTPTGCDRQGGLLSDHLGVEELR